MINKYFFRDLSFFIKDTYTGTADDPLSLNLYTYCHNEPLMYSDPTGHYYVYINGQGYTGNDVAEKRYMTGPQKVAYSEKLGLIAQGQVMKSYKSSNESQKLTNIGKMLYQSHGSYDIYELQKIVQNISFNGSNTAEALQIDLAIKTYNWSRSRLKSHSSGEIDLSDKQIDEMHYFEDNGYYFLNNVLGIDFDKNDNIIENDNLYLAYGARAMHSWDFTNSMVHSDVGAGFERVSQNMSSDQVASAFQSRWNYNQNIANKIIPEDGTGKFNLGNYEQRTGKKYNDTTKGTDNEIPEGKSFIDLMDANEAKLYERYWRQNYKEVFEGTPNTRQRDYTVPGERSIKDQKYSSTQKELYVRETIYDKFGRKIGTNDYSSHGRPKEHTNPHHHENPWDDPKKHKPVYPGLHPETP